MPLLSAASALYNAAYYTGLLSPGVLNDVSVFADEVGASVGLTLVDVGLCTIPFSLGTRKASLITGLVHWSQPLSWHGLLDVSAETYMYLMVQGDRNAIIRVESHRLVSGAKTQLGGMFNASTSVS